MSISTLANIDNVVSDLASVKATEASIIANVSASLDTLVVLKQDVLAIQAKLAEASAIAQAQATSLGVSADALRGHAGDVITQLDAPAQPA